jgi:hypothetical protein
MQTNTCVPSDARLVYRVDMSVQGRYHRRVAGYVDRQSDAEAWLEVKIAAFMGRHACHPWVQVFRR